MQTNRRNFLKHSGAAAFSLGMLPFLSKANVFRADPISNGFTRATPESQGISSVAIRQFISAAQASGLYWHSFMLLRHGHVVAEGWWKPFDANYKHTLYSLSKSFTSTAIGLLVKDGKVNVNDSVLSFFQDELPSEISDNLMEMKVKNLLTMNTGHEEDTTPKMREGTATWTKTFLSLPVEHKPGSHFLYNTGATYMLGAIVKKITGQDLETFLTPRLFLPLEINDHDWEKSPQGLNVAGWGLRVKTEDIAKLGQLYLQKGKWNGKEILTEAWVNDASRYQTNSNTGDSDWSQGYGYQFWRCKPGFFRGDGAFGQYCVVMPQHDAVLVVTSESWDMQKQMTIMWENLLPGMQSSPLAENEVELRKLKTDIASLVLPVAKGSITSSLSKKYNSAKWKFNANEYDITGIQFQFSEKGCVLQLDTSKGKHTIQSGWESWATNKESLAYPFVPAKVNLAPSKIASTATWMSENILQLNVKTVESIHGDKITCIFNGDKISLSFLNSIAENAKDKLDDRPKLEGILV
jgi:CubicO group peptidase (beta-lactamase class C family)